MSQIEKYYVTCQYPGCYFKGLEHKVAEHYNAVHLQVKKFKCSTCSFETGWQWSLDTHIKTQHQGKDSCRDGDHSDCHWNVSPNKKK